MPRQMLMFHSRASVIIVFYNIHSCDADIRSLSLRELANEGAVPLPHFPDLCAPTLELGVHLRRTERLRGYLTHRHVSGNDKRKIYRCRGEPLRAIRMELEEDRWYGDPKEKRLNVRRLDEEEARHENLIYGQ